MASYRVLIKSSAVNELESLSAKDRKRVAAKIEGLALDPPRPAP